MPPIRTENFSAFLAPDIYNAYLETGEERPLEFPYWCNVVDMPYQDLKTREVSGLGAMGTKPEGTQFAFDDPIDGNTQTHTAVSYGMAVEFTYEMWRDELYGLARDWARELRRSSNYRLEVDAHYALNEGFVTTNRTVFDGLALYSTAHTRLDGGATIANRPTTEIQPSLTGIQNGVIHFHNLVNDRGLPMLLAPSFVMLSPEYMYDIREILGSPGKPYTADNEMNALINDELRWMISHYLDVSTHWHMLAAKGRHDVTFYVMDRPMFDMFDDPRTMNAVATVYQAHQPSRAGQWRGTYGSTG